MRAMSGSHESPSPPLDVDDDVSEGKKQLIRLEEMYRARVRNRLRPKAAPFRATVWAFVNSSFALWLFSALFITAAGSGYNAWTAHRNQERARVATIERLDMELSYRFFRAFAGSRHVLEMMNEYRLHARRLEEDKGAREFEAKYKMASAGEKLPDDRKQFLTKRVAELNDKIFTHPHPAALLHASPTGHYAPFYPEYANFNVLGLLSELRRAVDTDDERREIDREIRLITSEYYDPANNPRIAEADLLCLVTKKIHQDLVLPRWRDKPFDYLNHPPGKPYGNWGTNDGKPHFWEMEYCKD